MEEQKWRRLRQFPGSDDARVRIWGKLKPKEDFNPQRKNGGETFTCFFQSGKRMSDVEKEPS